MAELSDIVGQDGAVWQLRRAVASGRLPHALLFAGPEGVGRRTTAEALARALLCASPATAASPPESGKTDGVARERGPRAAADPTWRQGCGQCPDCKLMTAGTHPDYHLIYKELVAYHEDPEVRKRIAQQLSIDVIRGFLIAPAGRASSRGRGKVFVVREAELMSNAAQNALLKTLEEPPAGVTIVLICERPEEMLPTTLSRCTPVRFGALPRAFVDERLINAGVPKVQAEFWAAFTEGSVGRSLRLAETGMYEVKCRIVERLSALGQAGEADLGEDLIKTMDQLATDDLKRRKQTDDEDGREGSKRLANRRASGVMLAMIAGAYRDALGLLTSAGEALVNSDQAPQVRTIAERFEPIQLAEILEQLAQYERLLWRNVNPRTVWDNVAITCASAAPLRL